MARLTGDRDVLDDQSGVVRRTLQTLVDADAPVGLVIFSDVPYELLPPGAPAKELKPIIRLLTPTGGKVVSPWSETFRSGTRISTALQLARDMLVGDKVKDGSILLVGRTHGGRILTVVLNPDQRDEGAWHVRTAWPSSDAQARRYHRDR